MLTLSVDVEDWFHQLEVPSVAAPARWSELESRFEEPLTWLLDVLAERDLRATFFWIGWLARRRPELVRRMAEAGHEIGTHSDLHRAVTSLTPKAFEADLRASLGAIEDAIQRPVRLHRAPGFSITREANWALEVLCANGIEIDSSLAPGWSFHGGFHGLPGDGPIVVETASGPLRELPLTFTRIGGARLCLTGGGMFRLAPWSIIAWSVRSRAYTMSYFHPRDFDPGVPSLPNASIARRLRQNIGLHGARRKFVRLMDRFEIGSIGQTAETIDWSAAPRLQLGDQSSAAR